MCYIAIRGKKVKTRRLVRIKLASYPICHNLTWFYSISCQHLLESTLFSGLSINYPQVVTLYHLQESISTINFSSKASRYICSGGSGQVVRIWDLQRKRCIKWLKGHTDTISGVMYNCKDEHLASISLNGNLILHNLASGAKAAELKDPNEQVNSFFLSPTLL